MDGDGYTRGLKQPEVSAVRGICERDSAATQTGCRVIRSSPIFNVRKYILVCGLKERRHLGRG